jgi:NADH:ubiquinone oxidoreductase subunit E
MKLYVCVGSSCLLKGSYDVAQRLQQLINNYHISNDEVELTAGFCLGKCSANGITVKIGDEILFDANINNIDKIFSDKILSKLEYSYLIK